MNNGVACKKCNVSCRQVGIFAGIWVMQCLKCKGTFLWMRQPRTQEAT